MPIIHTLTEKLDNGKSRALMSFHAFSGCDNVSGCKGKGKKILFQTWSNFPEAIRPTRAALFQQVFRAAYQAELGTYFICKITTPKLKTPHPR